VVCNFAVDGLGGEAKWFNGGGSGVGGGANLVMGRSLSGGDGAGH
jgi:hypothetical protein